MDTRKLKLLKEEFYKQFCTEIKSPWISDCGDKMYLFKDGIGEARPRLVWTWIEKNLK